MSYSHWKLIEDRMTTRNDVEAYEWVIEEKELDEDGKPTGNVYTIYTGCMKYVRNRRCKKQGRPKNN